ncbi:MAG: iron ABC transporter permease [Candidatus Omnitrophota bacterium]
MNPSLKRKILLLLVILVFALLLGITKGSVKLSVVELLLKENRQIFYLRLSRILLAIITGSGLAVSGIVLQAVLRNPLAEPYLLGTSSGAGLAAVLAIIIGISSVYLPFVAFLGAILAILLVYNLAKRDNKIPVQSLVLSGVIVSIALSSIIVFLISVSVNETLHGILWWLWGSLQVYDFRLLFIVSIIVVIGTLMVFVLSQDLNAISIGEEEAIHLGVKTETIKKALFFITSLITASLVCICGVIGFVGLIIPHAMRFIVGPNHKVLIPVSCLAASAFMIICDLLSRTIMSPLEIPIGVITAIVGAPIFIILFKTSNK